MAKLIVCAVFDSAVQSHARPFFVQSAAVAVRSFTDEVNRKTEDNTMNRHPDDFSLKYMGVYDEESGVISDQESARVLVRAKDVVQ